MNSPSEKHMAAAADLAERIDFAYRSRRHELHFASVSSLLATALANAEREGMKRAAEIAKAYYDARHAALARAHGMNIAAAILSESERA